MTRDNERFAAPRVDEQPDRRVVQSLQRFYTAQAQQEAQSLKRVSERLAAHSTYASKSNASTQEEIPEPVSVQEHGSLPVRPTTHKRRMSKLAQTLAAVLVVAVLLGGYLALFAWHHSGPGQPATTESNPHWCVIPSPNGGGNINELDGVTAISANDTWAVGFSQVSHDSSSALQGLIEHWNGKQWSIVPNPGASASVQAQLSGVAAVSANNVWAVGNIERDPRSGIKTLIEHWDGKQWSIIPSPNVGMGDNVLYGLTALSTENIWAVGHFDPSFDANHVPKHWPPSQAIIEHWNGSQWSLVSSPGLGASDNMGLSAVTAISTNNVWAVGSILINHGQPQLTRTLIEHWNGSRWSVVPSVNPGPDYNRLQQVSAISANDVWAVGNVGNNKSGSVLIEHWDGSRWSVVVGANGGTGDSFLNGVAAISADNVWAVGYFYDAQDPNYVYHTLIEHWNGRQWTIFSSPGLAGDNSLNGVAAVSKNKVLAVGDSGRQRTLVESTC